MMIRKIFIILLGVLSLLACSEGDTGEITGRIAMKGTSIHTYLVIVDEKTKKSLKLNNHERFNLAARQNENVTLKVKLLKKSIAAGFPAVVEVIEVK